MISRRKRNPNADEATDEENGEDAGEGAAPPAGEALPADPGQGDDEGAGAGDGTGDAPPVPLTGHRLQSCVEAILFAAPEPLPLKRLRRLLPEADRQELDDALLALEADLISRSRGFTLVEEAAGFRLLTRAEFAPYVARLRGEKRRVRLSQAAFETLAVISYRQPVRRADLDAIRGVQSSAILKNLLEWNLIRIVGRDDTIGKPLLYGTTAAFLEQFGLSNLQDLPDPDQLLELGGDRGLIVSDRLEPEGGDGNSPAGEEADEPPAKPRGDPLGFTSRKAESAEDEA